MNSVTIKLKYNSFLQATMQLFANFKKSFSFDDRSLALYRFFLGILVMADVIYRTEDIVNFYTDVGLIPRSIFTGEMAMPWSFSFHLANGSTLFISLMFILQFMVGLMLCLGYKTRLASIFAYLFAVSIHNRNWLVNNGGDDVFRAILFLSIFLPLAQTFSIDSALRKEDKKTDDFFSTWVFAFIFQIFAIYFVSYILKTSPIWRKEFTAFFYSSRLDIFATPLGVWTRSHPLVGKGITFLSIVLEWIGPLFLVFSFLFGRLWWVVRTTLVLLFVGFHFGIFLTMNIGLFTFICEAMWLVILPGAFWDKIEAYYRAKNFDKIKIFYDADCGFCQKSVRLIREFLLFRSVLVLPAQETASVYAEMQKNHSWVVETHDGKRFFQYQAFLEILKHSPVGHFFLFFFRSAPVRFLGHGLYLWISHHRDLMGKMTQFLEYEITKKEIVSLKWLKEAAGAFVLVTLVMWNLTTIKSWNIQAPFFQTVTRWLHLYQEWNMFAPYPKMDNVWVEIPALLSDGSQIELLTNSRDVFSVKDQDFYKTISNEHWRKFYLNLSDSHVYARYFGGYLCRAWNDRKIGSVPDTTLRRMEIVVYSQPNLPDGDRGGISRKLSWKHWCFDEDYKRENPPKQ